MQPRSQGKMRDPGNEVGMYVRRPGEFWDRTVIHFVTRT